MTEKFLRNQVSSRNLVSAFDRRQKTNRVAVALKSNKGGNDKITEDIEMGAVTLSYWPQHLG